MNTNPILLRGNDLYLSKAFLKGYMSVKTIEHWITNHIGYQETIDGCFYILYKTIPLRSRKKLPSEATIRKLLKEDAKEAKLNRYFKILEWAYYKDYSRYLSIYETESSLSAEQVTRFSRLHAVLQALIDLKQGEAKRDLLTPYMAFNRLYPNKYNSKNALSNVICKAMSDGIMNVALDKRVFGNNKASKKEANPQVQYAIAMLVSCNGKFTNPVLLEKANTYFREHGLREYKPSWMKIRRQEWLRNIEVYKSRYGQLEVNKISPYASLKHGKYSNDQWQMDGWKLPFWGPEFQSYWIVRLIDSCSKMVVGYSIGTSENTTLIMEAIRDAITKTGIIPFEIVTDNHAFNQTKEAQNIIQLLHKKGAKWTVTSNPQHKSIVERYNQHLDTFCKNKYGYLGQGIRSKSIDATASDEQKAEYAKHLLSHDEIIANGVYAVETYNTTKGKTGKTPIELYQEHLNPHPITANEFDRAELLIHVTEKKISRGQITIVRSSVKHEFQLSADLFAEYNNKTVAVHYENLSDGIYLFEKETGEAIAFLPPKAKINSAQVNQTPEDQEAFNRLAGRKKGIKAKAQKQLVELTEKAHQIDPDAFERLSALTTPKHVLQDLEQSAHLRRAAEEKGVRMELLYVDGRQKDTVSSHLKPAEKKHNPFGVKDNTISLIDPKEFDHQ